jgi:hypothetical protein
MKKACKFCGKIEEMAASCETCLACRIKKLHAGPNKSRHSYYLKNKKRILEQMKDLRLKKKTGERIPSKRFKPRRLTVHFIKTEGGYTWKAYFENPVTERLVRFESGQTFKTMLMAKEDYKKATY